MTADAGGYHKVDTPQSGRDGRAVIEGEDIGDPLNRTLIILQTGRFVNIQNAQMMDEKFFLSNNTGWGHAVYIPCGAVKGLDAMGDPVQGVR